MLLLYTANTGNGRRSTIMVEECGVPYRLCKVEIGKASRKPPELLAINPQGTIPTLVDPEGPGGQPLTLRQSSAILLYLAEKYRTLLTAEAERPAMLEWMMFAATDVVAANTAMYQAMNELPHAAASEFFRDQLLAFLRVCDTRLKDMEWLAGSAYTIADVALYPVLVSRQALIEQTPELDNLKRWGAAISARPPVKRALAACAG
jgi:GST-like protein